MIFTINAEKLRNFSDLLISNYAADVLISNAIDAENSTGCAKDDAGIFIDAINSGN